MPSLDRIGDPYYTPPYYPPPPVERDIGRTGGGGGVGRDVTPEPAEPPLYTPPSAATPPEISALLGENPQLGWSAGWGGVFSFFPRRRRPRLSQLERAARAGARVVERALQRALERVLRGPAPPKGGLPIPRPGWMPEVPGRISPFLGRLLGLGSLAIPSRLGTGELPPDWQKLYPNLAFPELKIPPGVREIGIGSAQFPLGKSIYTSTAAVLLQMPTPPAAPKSHVDRDFQDWLRDFGRGVITNLGYEWLGDQLGLPPMPSAAARDRIISQEPRSQSVPVPAIPQINIPAPAPSQPAPRVPYGQIAGAILGGLVTERFGRAGRAPAQAPAESATTAVPPLTGFNVATLSFAQAAADTSCNCKPRGPRRKCLQRAPVKWSGGPRKGRAAGTRCIRYATRKFR